MPWTTNLRKFVKSHLRKMVRADDRHRRRRFKKKKICGHDGKIFEVGTAHFHYLLEIFHNKI